ncbi:MAG: amino acid ABC transporter substrate-binding protein [Clostridiales bacterium]|nr:amino acid ABC transporter substrate-binding protein [Clostridiales bacterium]
MKKTITKIVSLVLVACMGVAFAACSGSGSDENNTDASEAGSFTTVEEGKLIMATNAYFPPYEFYEGDAISGIDVEIAEAVADKLGLELVIVDIEFDSIIAGVQTNKYDIGCAGMTVTEERLQSVNFTTPYATGIQSIIVAEGSPITDIDSLIDGDYVVGVQQGTTGDIYMTDDIGDDRIERYNKGADAVLALTNGQIDAVCIDNQPAQAFVAANEGLTILDTPYTEEDYAMCLNKENEDLLNAINDALAELTEDGTIDAIIEKYIPSEG